MTDPVGALRRIRELLGLKRTGFDNLLYSFGLGQVHFPVHKSPVGKFARMRITKT